MTEQCKADGSIQKLVANKWKTVGIGQLILLKNKHNPTQMLLKLIRKKNNEVHIFQCKPKSKTNGKSLILKGTDTKKKKEFVLAIRFNADNAMQQFQTTLDKLYRRNQSIKTPSRHQRKASRPPKELRMELSQYAWDCELCTYRNEPTVFDCEVCKHPRPLKIRQIPKIHPVMHPVQDSFQIDDLPPVSTPTLDGSNSSNAVSIKKAFPDTTKLAAVSESKPNDQDKMVMVEDDKESKEEEKEEEKKEDEEEEKSSIKELIIKVTNGEEVSSIKHTTVEDILLLCHDTFTDSETMLRTLLDRLCDKNLIDVNARIRGVKMVESWIRNYWEQDFSSNDKMMDIMYDFIDNLSNIKLRDSDCRLLTRIKSTFVQKQNSNEIERKRALAKSRSIKILGDVDVPKNYDIMKETSQCIAEQLTLMDFNLFSSITKRELTGQGWKKKDREKRSPHLLLMIKQFNQISKWVQCVVLQQINKKKRTRCIEKFIHIAVHLKELRNFSACCAVNFGLSGNVLYRLKDAWNDISKKELKQYNEIQTVYKGKKNWELLRILHKNAYAPSILHTGLFLQDLLNTDEGNEDKTKDGTVNFNKLKTTYKLIEQICMYQGSQYFKIQTNHIMQQYLKDVWKKQATYNDDKMYQISTIVKNKDVENKDIEDSDLVLIAW